MSTHVWSLEMSFGKYILVLDCKKDLSRCYEILIRDVNELKFSSITGVEHIHINKHSAQFTIAKLYASDLDDIMKEIEHKLDLDSTLAETLGMFNYNISDHVKTDTNQPFIIKPPVI